MVLRSPSLRLVTRCKSWSCTLSKRHLSSKPQHDPLRVVFCGADEFSIYSLRALNKIRIENPEKVASIDVVCKKDKRVGRGLKQIRQVPIKSVAGPELGLNVHQIDTFTGWTPPQMHDQPFNMVVAVSFGLLVPPRILNAAKYGGLNIHPSMLPDLRGPAPLHHTLLRRLDRTGVTLQTLHPKHFDEGRIIDQTPSPGLSIPDLASATVDSLLTWIGPLGAEMLYTNITNGNFASPDQKHTEQSNPQNTADDLFGQLDNSSVYPRHARKILPEDRHLSFDWPVGEIVLRDRVLGRLFALESVVSGSKRVTFHGLSDATDTFQELGGDEKASIKENTGPTAPGSVAIFRHDKERRIFLRAQDGWVSPVELTIEGMPKQRARVIFDKL